MVMDEYPSTNGIIYAIAGGAQMLHDGANFTSTPCLHPYQSAASSSCGRLC